MLRKEAAIRSDLEVEVLMQKRFPNIEALQRLTRIFSCDHCPYRCPSTRSWNPDAARPCEANCPLFAHLPMLRETARLVDPMLAEPLTVLSRVVTASIPGQSRKAQALRARGMQVAKRLNELSPN